MNKKEYCKAIGNRILTVMNSLGMKQKDLLELAEAHDYGIKQAVLSKICNGTLENPSIMTLVQIADILNIDFNELFSLDINLLPSSVIQKPLSRDLGHEAIDNQFITSPNNVHMKPYLNRYHAYFLPTKSDEYTPLHGLLSFKSSDDNERVEADFCFKTGKKDALGGEIEKKYKGEMVISTHMSAVYCWLRNDDFGEISYIMFHYIPITYERLFSRVGLVITSCAGNPRVPTAHRIIISVPEIKQEDLDIIQGQLYMNTREILISELGMEKMLKRKEVQENEHIKELFQKSGFEMPNLGISPLSYYRIEEATIRRSFQDDSESELLAINLLRQYSNAPRYIKVSEKSDRFLYKYLLSKYGQSEC